MGLLSKFVRYAGVSAISTVVSLTILGALVASGATSAAWANVVATIVGTAPSFELNRRWVWNRTGRRSLLREIGPFSALSMLSLALSTLAVAATAGWVDGWQAGATVRTVVAEAAHVGTFGLLWVVQYLLLDRILFRSAPPIGPAMAPTAGGPPADNGHESAADDPLGAARGADCAKIDAHV
jgi:putative flippase GtrA